MTTVRDIVPNAELIMGCKAVFGPLSSHALCFAGRGEKANATQYYSVAAGVARRSIERPYIIAIGGGSQVRGDFRGRVLNIARSAKVYGDTSTILDDEAEIRRLARWPVAIALHDVWRLRGDPKLLEELGMPDRRILEGAVDGVIRHDARVEALWEKIVDWPVELASLRQASNFYDSGVPTLATGGHCPAIPNGLGSEEGRRIWKLQRSVERRRELARAAKQLSADRHGMPTCEACYFSHADFGMFDAHHPRPLAAGERQTIPEHLDVLCPTCHRRAHLNDRLRPLAIDGLREWVARGRA